MIVRLHASQTGLWMRRSRSELLTGRQITAGSVVEVAREHGAQTGRERTQTFV